jgi:TatA/E family protein of Tat protein translocase
MMPTGAILPLATMLSVPHMIVLFVIVLVVFGPNKLPELARGFGKLMAEFRKASLDFKTAFEEEMRDLERQAREAERKKAAGAVAPPQPATLATPAMTETVVPEDPAPSADIPFSEGDSRLTEAPVVTPAAESVPRSPEEPRTEPTPPVQEVTTPLTHDE